MVDCKHGEDDASNLYNSISGGTKSYNILGYI